MAAKPNATEKSVEVVCQPIHDIRRKNASMVLVGGSFSQADISAEIKADDVPQYRPLLLNIALYDVSVEEVKETMPDGMAGLVPPSLFA